MVKKAKAKPKKLGSGSNPRVRKLDRKLKRLKAKKAARSQGKIPNSFRLTGKVFGIFKSYWKPLGGIVIVYLILNIIFASGLGNLNTAVKDIKANLSTNGHIHLGDALGGFSSLVGSSGTSNSSTGSILQALLVIIESLVIIWSLRQLLAGEKVRVKQAFYSAMTPLVPFLLVLFVVLLQLVPITFGGVALAVILSSVFTASTALSFVFAILFGLLGAWSVYMLSSSIFALYIVTLPDMQPRQALRSAKNLVRFRRWMIMRRLLFLPIFILLVMAVIIVPMIAFATWFVAPVFYILSGLAILFIHSYLYSLYRGLLG